MKKSKATYDKIIQKLQLGNSLTSICVDKAMPGLTQVHQWMKDDQKFKDQVLAARRIGTMVWLDKMQDLLDSDVEPQQVQWNREKLHHARWMASKLISIFGDKKTVENNNNVWIQKKVGNTIEKGDKPIVLEEGDWAADGWVIEFDKILSPESNLATLEVVKGFYESAKTSDIFGTVAFEEENKKTSTESVQQPAQQADANSDVPF